MLSDDQIERLLQENQRLIRENNKMLKKMRRDAVIGHIMKVIWVLILIGVPVMLYYYFLAPYVQQARETYQQIQESAEKVKGLEEQIPDFSFEVPDVNIPDWAKSLLAGENNDTNAATPMETQVQ